MLSTRIRGNSNLKVIETQYYVVSELQSTLSDDDKCFNNRSDKFTFVSDSQGRGVSKLFLKEKECRPNYVMSSFVKPNAKVKDNVLSEMMILGQRTSQCCLGELMM